MNLEKYRKIKKHLFFILNNLIRFITSNPTLKKIKDAYEAPIVLVGGGRLNYKIAIDNNVLYGKTNSIIHSYKMDNNAAFSFYNGELHPFIQKGSGEKVNYPTYQDTPNANEIDNIWAGTINWDSITKRKSNPVGLKLNLSQY